MRVLQRVALLVLVFGASPAVARAQQWTVSFERDEGASVMKWLATSPAVRSSSPLVYPYSGARAWIGFGCLDRHEWAFVRSSEIPSLMNGIPLKGGSSLIPTRVQWDDRFEEIELEQGWSSRELTFRAFGPAVLNMTSAASVSFDLDWYGGPARFRMSLKGAGEAISLARQQCRGES